MDLSFDVSKLINTTKERYFSDVISTQILEINEPVNTFSNSNHHTLLYSCEGHGQIQINNQKNEYSANSINFDENYVVYINSGSEYVINTDSSGMVLMVIHFDLFITNATIKNDEGHTIFKTDPCSFPLFPLLKSDDPLILSLIENMVNIVKNSPEEKNLLCNLLNAHLERHISSYVANFQETICCIYAVIFQSQSPLTQDVEFQFKNVEIWSENPEIYPKAELLFETRVEHKYIENTEDFKYQRFFENKEEVCKISLKENNNYKIWFFPKNFFRIDLSPYWSTAWVKFSMKSNFSSHFHFFLVNKVASMNYKFLRYRFNVVESEKWQTYSFLLSKSFSQQSSSIYVNAATNYIRQNFTQKLSLQKIAGYLNIHSSYLTVLFRKHLNQSVNQYIISCRIMKAKELLLLSEQSLESIAEHVGFYDQSHFTKTFQKQLGITPTQYKAKHRK